jgi:hypothetical protein
MIHVTRFWDGRAVESVVNFTFILYSIRVVCERDASPRHLPIRPNCRNARQGVRVRRHILINILSIASYSNRILIMTPKGREVISLESRTGYEALLDVGHKGKEDAELKSLLGYVPVGPLSDASQIGLSHIIFVSVAECPALCCRQAVFCCRVFYYCR